MRILFLLLSFTFSNDAIANFTSPVTYSVPSFEPFAFKNTEDCQGVATQITDKLFTDLSINSEYQSLPYSRILYALSHNKLDLALLFKNQNIANSTYYIGPISLSKVLIISPKQRPINDYQDLHRLTSVAVIRNAHFHPQFDNDQKINKISVRDYQHAIKMLEKQRVDAVIGSEIGLSYALSQLNNDKSYIQEAYHLGNKAWYFHINRQSPLNNYKASIEAWVSEHYQADLMLQTFLKLNHHCLSNQG